jgi:hypothetical protein
MYIYFDVNPLPLENAMFLILKGLSSGVDSAESGIN